MNLCSSVTNSLSFCFLHFHQIYLPSVSWFCYHPFFQRTLGRSNLIFWNESSNRKWPSVTNELVFPNFRWIVLEKKFHKYKLISWQINVADRIFLIRECDLLFFFPSGAIQLKIGICSGHWWGVERWKGNKWTWMDTGLGVLSTWYHVQMMCCRIGHIKPV